MPAIKANRIPTGIIQNEVRKKYEVWLQSVSEKSLHGNRSQPASSISIAMIPKINAVY